MVRNVVIGSVFIEVEIEIRENPQEGTVGLGRRSNLKEGSGMLFIGDRDEKDNNLIWMKDMKFPIDIIWIGKGKVIHIVESASIPTKEGIPEYGFVGYCDYVVELKAGFVKRHGIKVGDDFSGVKPDEF